VGVRRFAGTASACALVAIAIACGSSASDAPVDGGSADGALDAADGGAAENPLGIAGPASPLGPNPLGPAPAAVKGGHSTKGHGGRGETSKRETTHPHGTGESYGSGDTGESGQLSYTEDSSFTIFTTEEFTSYTPGETSSEASYTESTGYDQIEPVHVDRQHPVPLALGTVRTVTFAWTDAAGLAPPADLAVIVDGRPALQVASLGTHPFARAGLDLVGIEPRVTYSLRLSRSEAGINLSLRGPGGDPVLDAEAPLTTAGDDVAVAIVVLPAPAWRASITASFPLADGSPSALSEDSAADLAEGMSYGDGIGRP
jgi:hypothetical protein